MSVGKLGLEGSLNSMISNEAIDSLDTFIRQAVVKDPLIPFTRAGDNPVSLFHHPDIPGFPFLTPWKAQMQKCEKCSHEFCSSINYRRHARVHRRSFNVKKASQKNRELLAAFWDKLTLKEAKETVSLDDVMLKELSGSTIIMAVAASLRKPGVWSLPQAYVKAGSTLLDIIHAKPSGLPISSKELFDVLDGASESTFLCAGTADVLQTYLFHGEDTRQCLNLENVIATASFLFEKQLVKAWVADKDAEALRCHKLLMEEEEAAQKRQAELLERKRQKKERQKEQKLREQLNERIGDLKIEADSVDMPASAEKCPPPSVSDSNSVVPDLYMNLASSPESTESQSKEAPNENAETHVDINIEHSQDQSQIIELEMVRANGHSISTSGPQHAIKLQRERRNGFHAIHNSIVIKPEPVNKFGPSKDRVTVNKVWTKKLATNGNKEDSKSLSVQEETSHKEQEDSYEVMIGSISVTLKKNASQKLDKSPCKPQDTRTTEHPILKKKNSEKPMRITFVQSGSSQATSKLWRPMSHGETKSTLPSGRENEDLKSGPTVDKVQERILSDEGSARLQSTNNNVSVHYGEDDHLAPDENLQGNLPFSSDAAKEFLARRWKEAISSEHLVLVLSPEPEQSNHLQGQNVLTSTENQLGRGNQAKFRRKTAKDAKESTYLNQKLLPS